MAEAVLEALASCAAPQGSSTASPETPKPLTSIAVLPFVFSTEVEERKAFSLGFADALITVLAGLEDFAVLPTSSILNYAAGIDRSTPVATWASAMSCRAMSKSWGRTGASPSSSSMA